MSVIKIYLSSQRQRRGGHGPGGGDLPGDPRDHAARAIQPPVVLRFNASSVPILQISVSSKSCPESEVYDYALWQMRQRLLVIRGLTMPSPYGGMERQVMVDLDPDLLQARGVSAKDVADAINAYNLALPTGVARIDAQEYPVSLNNSPSTAAAFNDIPIKSVNGAMVYIRDVAQVRDGFNPQTTVVRRDGNRGALVTILKNGGASTLDIVRDVKALMPSIRGIAPKGLEIESVVRPVAVRAGGRSPAWSTRASIAALLTATMILVFLGSWRSTLDRRRLDTAFDPLLLGRSLLPWARP